MSQSFWKDAAASMPPEVRQRYAADFEAAERYEEILELGFEAWARARRAFENSCRTGAQALRAAARMFDIAAQRLLLTH